MGCTGSTPEGADTKIMADIAMSFMDGEGNIDIANADWPLIREQFPTEKGARSILALIQDIDPRTFRGNLGELADVFNTQVLSHKDIVDLVVDCGSNHLDDLTTLTNDDLDTVELKEVQCRIENAIGAISVAIMGEKYEAPIFQMMSMDAGAPVIPWTEDGGIDWDKITLDDVIKVFKMDNDYIGEAIKGKLIEYFQSEDGSKTLLQLPNAIITNDPDALDLAKLLDVQNMAREIIVDAKDAPAGELTFEPTDCPGLEPVVFVPFAATLDKANMNNETILKALPVLFDGMEARLDDSDLSARQCRIWEALNIVSLDDGTYLVGNLDDVQAEVAEYRAFLTQYELDGLTQSDVCKDNVFAVSDQSSAIAGFNVANIEDDICWMLPDDVTIMMEGMGDCLSADTANALAKTGEFVEKVGSAAM